MANRRVLEVVVVGDSDSAEKAMERTAQAAGKVGDATEHAGARTSRAADQTENGMNRAAGAVGGLSRAAQATGQDLGSIPDVLDKVEIALDNASEKASKTSKALTLVGSVGVGLGAVFIAAGAKDEQALAQLKVALDNSGHSLDDWKGKLEEAANEQARFGHSNDDATEALAILTTASKDPAKAIDDLAIASDLAARNHLSLADAAKQVAGIYGGNIRVLKQFGIDTHDLVDSTKELEKAQREVSTSTGQLHSAQERLSNLEAQLAEQRKRAAEEHVARVQAATEKEQQAQQHLVDVQTSVAERRKAAQLAADEAVASSSERLGNARQHLADVEQRIHDKTQLTLQDQFSLRDAQQQLLDVQERIADGQLAGADAAQALRDAQQRVADTQTVQAEKTKATTADQRELRDANAAVTKATEEHASAVDKSRTAGQQTTTETRQLRDALAAVARAHEDLLKAEQSSSSGVSLSQLQQEKKLREEVVTAQAKQKTATEHLKQAQKDAAEHGTKVQEALNELEKRLHGAAEAQANTFLGHVHGYAMAVENFFGKYGESVGPALIATSAGITILGASWDAFRGIRAAFVAGQAAMAAAAVETAAVTGAAGAATIATEEGVAVASEAAGAATTIGLGPILIILAAIGIAAFLLYKHWDTVWGAIKTVSHDAWDFLKKGWDFLSNTVFLPMKLELELVEWVFGKVWSGIKHVWGGAGDFFRGVFSGVSDFVLAPMRLVVDVINTIIDAIDSIHFDFHAPSWLGGWGWKFDGFGIDHLPTFAVGGVFDGAPPGAPGLAVLHGGEAVFNQAQLRALGVAVRGGAGGGQYVIRIEIDARGALIPDQQSLDKLGRMVADGVHAALLTKQAGGQDLRIRDGRMGSVRS
jgi:hypothetical protein